MENQLKEAIKSITKQSVEAGVPSHAQQYAQAALNLSHALAELKESNR